MHFSYRVYWLWKTDPGFIHILEWLFSCFCESVIFSRRSTFWFHPCVGDESFHLKPCQKRIECAFDDDQFLRFQWLNNIWSICFTMLEDHEYGILKDSFPHLCRDISWFVSHSSMLYKVVYEKCMRVQEKNKNHTIHSFLLLSWYEKRIATFTWIWWIGEEKLYRKNIDFSFFSYTEYEINLCTLSSPLHSTVFPGRKSR